MGAVFQNIAYIALFIISGLVILKVLEHFNMRVAGISFAVLFGVLLLYVPFYFGGRFAMLISDFFFNEHALAEIFIGYTNSCITIPFIYVKLISLASGVVAAIFAIAVIIVSAFLALKVVEIVSKYIKRHREYEKCDPKLKVIFPSFVYILNNQYIYKKLLHLLN